MGDLPRWMTRRRYEEDIPVTSVRALEFTPCLVGARPDAPERSRVHHCRMGCASGARIAAALFATVVLGVAAAGCRGSHVDKAGGSAPAKPLVLTLATHDDDYAYGTFAAAVARLSGGSMRIRIAMGWRNTGDRAEIDYERGVVADVRSGKVPLGIVGV